MFQVHQLKKVHADPHPGNFLVNDKGELIIVDYKSGKAPNAKYKEPRFFALKLYALLIKNEIGETPAELKLIYLQNSTIHTMKVDEEMLKNAENSSHNN